MQFPSSKKKKIFLSKPINFGMLDVKWLPKIIKAWTTSCFRSSRERKTFDLLSTPVEFGCYDQAGPPICWTNTERNILKIDGYTIKSYYYYSTRSNLLYLTFWNWWKDKFVHSCHWYVSENPFIATGKYSRWLYGTLVILHPVLSYSVATSHI